MTGTISRLKLKDGYGFIEGEDGTDRFFYKNALVGVDFADLQEGDTVTFDHEDAPKGPRATNVREAMPVETGRKSR